MMLNMCVYIYIYIYIYMYVVELWMYVEGKIVWAYMCNDRGMMR
jgi:hypothetical protein